MSSSKYAPAQITTEIMGLDSGLGYERPPLKSTGQSTRQSTIVSPRERMQSANRSMACAVLSC